MVIKNVNLEIVNINLENEVDKLNYQKQTHFKNCLYHFEYFT